MEQKLSEVMKYERTLPEDFDGTFYFTNDSDEDFIGKWGGKEYRFAAHATSPILIMDASPLDIQQIRKKFARDWAVKEFGKSETYQKLLAQERNPDGTPRLNSIHQGGTYSDNDLIALIQRCLKPLPVKRAEVKTIEKTPIEDKLSRDNDGELNTMVVSQNADLIQERKSLRKKALS